MLGRFVEIGGGGCLVVFVVLGWFFLCVNVFMGGEGEL